MLNINCRHQKSHFKHTASSESWNSLPNINSQPLKPAASEGVKLRLKVVLAFASFSPLHLKLSRDWSMCLYSETKICSSTFCGTHDSWPLTGSRLIGKHVFRAVNFSLQT